MACVKPAPAQLATIICEDHSKILANGIKKLLIEDYFVDSNVFYKNVIFKVHRLVLAVFLPTLKAHMDNIPSGLTIPSSNEQIVNLDYIASAKEDVRALIEFVYSGKVTIPKESVKRFGQLAKDLNVDCLVKAVGDYWKSEEILTKANVNAITQISNVRKPDAVAGTKVASAVVVQRNKIPIDQSLVHKRAITNNPVKFGPSVGGINKPASTDTSRNGDVVQVPHALDKPSHLVHNQNSLQDRLHLKTTQPAITVKSTRKPLLFVARPKTCEAQEEPTVNPPKETISQLDQAPATKPDHEFEQSTSDSSEQDTSDSEEDDTTTTSTSDDGDLTQRTICRQELDTYTAQKTISASEAYKASVPADPEYSCSDSKDRDESIELLSQKVLPTWEEVKAILQKSGSKQNIKDTDESDKKSTRKRSEDVSTTVTTESFVCTKCDKKFNTFSSLHMHNMVCDKHQVYVCDICGYHTGKQPAFKAHVKEVHGKDPKDPEKAPMSLKCPHCPFTCNAKYKLRGHFIRRHTIDKKYKCPECVYSAMYKGEIDRHISLAHRKERPFKCDICGVRFQMQGGLNRHVIIQHHGIKPFQCEYCGKEFTNKRSENLHIQTKHTKVAPRLVCEFCGKSYSKRSGLQYHMKHGHGRNLEPLKKPYAPRQSLKMSTEKIRQKTDAAAVP